MKKIVFGFGAASLALSFAALAADPSRSASVDPVEHAVRAGWMSGQKGTRLATNTDAAQNAAVRAGWMSGQKGSAVPTNQQLKVAGPSDPVNTVIRAGWMEAPRDNAAASDGAQAQNTQR